MKVQVFIYHEYKDQNGHCKQYFNTMNEYNFAPLRNRLFCVTFVIYFHAYLKHSKPGGVMQKNCPIDFKNFLHFWQMQWNINSVDRIKCIDFQWLVVRRKPKDQRSFAREQSSYSSRAFLGIWHRVFQSMPTKCFNIFTSP